MFQFIFLLFCAVALPSNSVYATEDFRHPENKCLKDYGLRNDEIQAAVIAGDLSVIDSCFWGCYFKGIGFINEKGEYDPTVYLEKLKQLMSNDKERFYLEKNVHQCDSVKNVPVSDGEAGCEMGALLAACSFNLERKGL